MKIAPPTRAPSTTYQIRSSVWPRRRASTTKMAAAASTPRATKRLWVGIGSPSTSIVGSTVPACQRQAAFVRRFRGVSRGSWSALAGRPVDEFTHDVEVADVPGVLLHDVEQDRDERRRRLAGGEPAAGRGVVEQVVRRDDVGRTPAADVERFEEVVERTVGGPSPAPVLVVPRIVDLLTEESPHEPAALHVDEV